MLDEHHFHSIADATLMHLFDQIEPAYEAEDLEDLDMDEGILTIISNTGQQFIVSKHGPSRQLWLASPISGGLHFDYNHDDQCWELADGRTLKGVLQVDLEQCCGVKITF